MHAVRYLLLSCVVVDACWFCRGKTVACVQRWFLRTVSSAFAYLSDWTGSVGSSRVVQRVEGGWVSIGILIMISVRARPWNDAYLHPWRILNVLSEVCRNDRSLILVSFSLFFSPLFSVFTFNFSAWSPSWFSWTNRYIRELHELAQNARTWPMWSAE